MTTKLITVNALENTREVKTKYGVKRVWDLFATDGDKFTSWKKPEVVVGQTYEVEYTTSSYGNDLKGVRPAGGAPATTVAPSSPLAPAAQSQVQPPPAGGPLRPHEFNHGNQPFPLPLLHGNRTFVRKDALTAAVAVVGASGAVSSTSLSDLETYTIRMARAFEQYISGDSDGKAAADIKVQADVMGVPIAQLLNAQNAKNGA